MESPIAIDQYGEEDTISMLLRYGLFVAAIFQLVCIGASILLPTVSQFQGAGNEPCEEQKQTTDIINARRQHKIRKLEKKKRR